MFDSMRRVFGPVAVTLIVGAIALVFVFFGVYNPRTNGRAGGSDAATVNGDTIPMTEFSREYQQRAEMFQNMMKGKMDPKVLKQLHIAEQVVEDLIRKKLVVQAADRMGLTVSDAEVRDKIQEMPYFKDKAGKFDVKRYEAVLDANHYAPATFEDMIRQDLTRGRVAEFIRARAKVSENEVRDEFLAEKDRRQVDYVVVNPETAKKFILVGDKDVDALLADAKGQSEVRAHYERTKYNYVKPEKKTAKKDDKTPPKPDFESYDSVKKKVALDLLRERKGDEAAKIGKELANSLYEKAKQSPAELKSFAKSKGLEVKTSPEFNRLQGFVPGVGEMPDLVEDAFKDNSPLTQGPKLYEARQVYVVAENLKALKPDLSEFPKEKDKVTQTAMARKADQFFQTWMTDLRTHAKVSVNKSISAPATEDEETPASAPGDEE